MSPRAQKPPPVTVTEAARQLGVHRQRIYEWLRHGVIAKVQYPGTNALIPQAEIDRLLKDCTVPANRA